MAVKIQESWSFKVGGVTVSGGSTPSSTVAITVSEPGDMRDSGSSAGTSISADDWREIVDAVEKKLPHRYTGDPQR